MTKISVVVSLPDGGERMVEALKALVPRLTRATTLKPSLWIMARRIALARRFLARHGVQGSFLAIDEPLRRSACEPVPAMAAAERREQCALRRERFWRGGPTFYRWGEVSG